MRTLDEMVAAGKAKMTRKEATMKLNYDAAKTRMKTGYGLTPFNARMKTAYGLGVDAAVFRVDTEKWARNFKAKVS